MTDNGSRASGPGQRAGLLMHMAVAVPLVLVFFAWDAKAQIKERDQGRAEYSTFVRAILEKTAKEAFEDAKRRFPKMGKETQALQGAASMAYNMAYIRYACEMAIPIPSFDVANETRQNAIRKCATERTRQLEQFYKLAHLNPAKVGLTVSMTIDSTRWR